MKPHINARVWSKKKKKMMEVFSIVTPHNSIVTAEEAEPDDEFKLMLNFSTLDKNGTPIFTGDIVKIGLKSTTFETPCSEIGSLEYFPSPDGDLYLIAEILFHDNAIRFKVIDDPKDKDDKRVKEEDLWGYTFVENILKDEVAKACEVIGNIFEGVKNETQT